MIFVLLFLLLIQNLSTYFLILIYILTWIFDSSLSISLSLSLFFSFSFLSLCFHLRSSPHLYPTFR